MKRATPADAKELYEALTAAGTRPSPRLIAAKLQAAGFKANYRSIYRWIESGWQGKRKAAVESPATKAKRTIREMEKTVSAITGNPLTMLKDLVPEVQRAPEENLSEQEEKDLAVRLAFVCGKSILKEATAAAELMVKANPQGLGSCYESAVNGICASFEASERNQKQKGDNARDVTPRGANGHAKFLDEGLGEARRITNGVNA